MLERVVVAIEADIQEFQKNLTAAQRSMQSLGDRLQDIGGKLSLFVSTPLAGLGVAAVKSATEMDSLMRGLTAVSGSAEAAGAQFERLKEVAKLPGLGLEEAVQGSINLQAAGFNASQAEAALKGFGNALATVGKGKDDLEGVITALSQMASKGTISAEEINQIAERVPQIRQVMKDAFGTADTQALQSMKLSVNDFVNAVTAELGKLPQVTGGPQNSFENLGDTVTQLGVAFGQVLLPAILPMADALSGLASWLTNLSAPAQQVIAAVAALVAGTGPLLLAIGTALKLLPLLEAGFAVLTGPIGLTVAAIAALGAAWAVWGDDVERITTATVKAVGKWLDDKFGGTVRAVKKQLTQVVDDFSDMGAAVADVVQDAARVVERWVDDHLGPLFQSVNGLLRATGDFFQAFGRLVAAVVGEIASDVSGWVYSRLQPVFQFFGQILSAAGDAFRTLGGAIVGVITKTLAPIFDTLRATLMVVGGAFKDFAAASLSFVQKLVDGVVDLLTGALKHAFDVVTGKIQAVTDKFEAMYEAVVGHSFVPDMVAEIGTEFGKLDGLMVQPAASATESVGGDFEDLQTTVGEFSDALTGDGGATSAVGTLADALGGSKLGQGIAGFLGHFKGAGGVLDTVGQVLGMLTGGGGITGAIDQVASALKRGDLAGAVSAFVGNFTGPNGFLSKAKEIWDAFKKIADILGKIVDFFKKLPGGGITIGIGPNGPIIGTPGLGEQPHYAAGGLHPGGLRLVGELGPELEVTGPARYYSAAQTRSMLSGGDTGAQIRVLQAGFSAMVERMDAVIAENIELRRDVRRLQPVGR